jgi:hypothetical protein
MNGTIFNYHASHLAIVIEISRILAGESQAEWVAMRLLQDYPDVVCLWALADSEYKSGDQIPVDPQILRHL